MNAMIVIAPIIPDDGMDAVLIAGIRFGDGTEFLLEQMDDSIETTPPDQLGRFRREWRERAQAHALPCLDVTLDEMIERGLADLEEAAERERNEEWLDRMPLEAIIQVDAPAVAYT